MEETPNSPAAGVEPPPDRGRGRPRLTLLLLAASLAGLALSTLVYPASTRAWAWPWWIFQGIALAGPVLLLALRSGDAARPLALPAPRWLAAVALLAGTILAACSASPYRPVAFLFAAPWLASIAWHLVIFDFLQADPASAAERRAAVWRAFGVAGLLIAAASAGGWLLWALERRPTLGAALAARNPYPLGHSNYTAGIALLALPAFVAGSVKLRGAARAFAAIGAALAAWMLLTSASRGAYLALIALTAAALSRSAVQRRLSWPAAAAVLLAVALLSSLHPRTRALWPGGTEPAPPNVSNTQRNAMALAGARMGLDRPLLGWGPGTTPLVFPRYRAGLDGGAENVLQLHATPVQLWAEVGAAGLLAALLLVLLAAGRAAADPLAALTLAGYAAFSLFDWQLDVPVFGFGVATLLALLAPTGPPRPQTHARWAGAAALAVVALVVIIGRRDPTPALNVAALSEAVGRKQPERAAELLRASLARNPDQEIAHFNLGWLWVVNAPAEAAGHFRAAATLVPDKGGVYFGLGLARLNQGDSAGAARAFALEAVNDPAFLLSPWWREPAFAALAGRVHEEFDGMLDAALARLPLRSWAAGEARYLRALAGWLAGRAPAARVLDAANTRARRGYFSGQPRTADFTAAGFQERRNQRIGYPTLMRNLDIPAPWDLWTIHESRIRSSGLAPLLPEKGWLPSPLLLSLLEPQPVSAGLRP